MPTTWGPPTTGVVRRAQADTPAMARFPNTIRATNPTSPRLTVRADGRRRPAAGGPAGSHSKTVDVKVVAMRQAAPVRVAQSFGRPSLLPSSRGQAPPPGLPVLGDEDSLGV